jgi:CHRD domain
MSMKRHLVLLAVALLAFAGYAGAQAATSAHKTVICHATKSGKKPYVRIVTANRAIIRAHTVGHHGDIIDPAGGVCPSQPLSFARGGRPVSATLTPISPNTVGSGTFVGRANIGQGRICWKLTVADLTDVTAAHIHFTSNGQIAVGLTLPVPFEGTAIGCSDTTRALVKQILMHPENFYVNIHTTTYPTGALSGTLHKGAHP